MRILFVCTGNTGRSIMAEGIFNKLAENLSEEHIAMSAGIQAPIGEPPEKSAIKVMRERGIHIEEHRAQQITKKLVELVDLVLTMEQSHKTAVLRLVGESSELERKIHLLTEFVGEQGGIIDCYGHDLSFYEECADRLAKLIQKVINQLEEKI